MDDEMAALMGFGGFGKKKVVRQAAVAQRLDKTRREEESTPTPPPPAVEDGKPRVAKGPAAPPPAPEGGDGQPAAVAAEPEWPGEEAGGAAKEAGEDEEDEDEDALEPETERDPFPVSHEVMLKDHTKPVSALALDPAGARLVSGSHDYDVKLWDFGGMDTGFRPFKSWEAAGSYHIHDLHYSLTGDSFLVVPGSVQAKLFDRDGQEIAEFVRGDMYLRDMKHTKGHVAELSAGAWHPKDHNTFITSAADSTVRIWDVNNKREQKTVVVVKSKERGTRTKVTACAYNGDGGQIAAAGLDGTLHIWSTSGSFSRPNATIEGAHTKNTWTSSVVYSLDGRQLISRGGDDTVKTWDVRNFRKPLAVAQGLPKLYQETNVTLSPDGKYVLTGVASPRGQGRPTVVALEREGLAEARRFEVGPQGGGSVIKVLWHSRINQIIATTNLGSMHVLYSPQTSLRGALLPLSKAPKARRDIEDILAATDPDRDLHQPIITPHALPMFRDEQRAGEKRKRTKEESEARKPVPPLAGPGKGGRVGASATQYVVQRLFRDNTREQDPREELLKYANADDDPKWTAAWKKNQPKPVFREVEEDDNAGESSKQ